MKFLIALLSISITSNVLAAQFDVQERVHLYRVYRAQSKTFASHKARDLKQKVLKKVSDIRSDYLKRVDDIIPSPFVDSIAFHLFVDKDEERLEQALSFLMLNRFLLVKQILDDPKRSDEAKERASSLLSKWSGLEVWDETSTKFMLELIQRKASIISDIGSTGAVIEAIEQTPILSDRLSSELGIKSALLAEPVGSISGNIVSVFFKNDRSLARASALKESAGLEHSDPKRQEVLKALGEDSLVKPLFEMIANSKENLILVTPETMGVSEDLIVNSLKKKLEAAPEWRMVLIGLGKVSPKLLTLASEHRSRFAVMAIPDIATRDSALSWQSFIPTPDSRFGAQHGLGLMAITDSASTIPHAFITSRRFIDHPHAYSFEQSAMLQGPAAGLLPQLLHENLKQLMPSYTDLSTYFPSRTHYPEHGQEFVKLSVDSARLEVRDDRAMAVKFLLETKEKVLLDQFMLYDKAIVDTLIKLKIKNPELQVLVLLDTNFHLEMNGLPNAIFIRELKDYHIQVKGRKSLNWEETNDQNQIAKFHALNHRNMIIRDDQDVFMGSAPFTGSFERRSPISFGLQFSSSMSSEMADNFMSDWNNADLTYELDIENYEAKLGDKRLSKKVSSFLNDVFALLLRAFD
ncbi:MAG: hypothetical protein CME71_08865 [Halobacteriovorax sp.]|nr:hypothetical protein [Halobacteriovorax sp.]